MSELVTSLDSVFSGIKGLNGDLPSHPELADRLGQAHAFYVLEQADVEPLFGFSKYVGYRDMTPQTYLREYKKLDGRNTEHALSKWFEEVRPGSSAYEDLYGVLAHWLAQYGKRPRGGKAQHVRIMVVRPEFRKDEPSGDGDRRLLNLLIAVADTLPTNQRHELRAVL